MKSLRKEDARYVVVPVCGTFTSWFVRTVIGDMLWSGELAAWQGALLGFMGWAAAVTVTYLVSRYFVFRSREPMLKELALYVRNRLGTMVIESALMALFTGVLMRSASTASLMSSACVIVLNWILTRRLMLKKEKDGDA